jgi:hypothetical protein
VPQNVCDGTVIPGHRGTTQVVGGHMKGLWSWLGFTRIRFRGRPDEGHSRVRYADSGARISCQCMLRGVPRPLVCREVALRGVPVDPVLLKTAWRRSCGQNKPYSSCSGEIQDVGPSRSDSIKCTYAFPVIWRTWRFAGARLPQCGTIPGSNHSFRFRFSGLRVGVISSFLRISTSWPGATSTIGAPCSSRLAIISSELRTWTRSPPSRPRR